MRILLPLLIAMPSVACATEYESFTEPVRQIEASIAETGRVASIHVERGDQVQPNQPLVSLDSAVLDASLRSAQTKAGADAKLQRLQVEHQLRIDRLEKLKELEQSGAGSPEEVTRAEADAKVAELDVLNAQQELELLQLQVNEIEARIQQRRVTSPIRGVVVDVHCEEGEYVSSHSPHVVTLAKLDQLRATFYVPASAAQRLAGLNADGGERIVNVVFPDSQESIRGSITHISPVTLADSGRVRVDVLINNADGKFRSGARVRIRTDRRSLENGANEEDANGEDVGALKDAENAK